MKKSAATFIRACGFLAALTAGLAFSLPAAAERGGHGGFHHGGFHHGGHGGFYRGFHGGVFLGFGPFWPYYDPFFYPYPLYYGPPAYYPVPYAAPAPGTVASQANCIRFNGDATNDQTGQPFYGIACLQADGKWHIVSN